MSIFKKKSVPVSDEQSKKEEKEAYLEACRIYSKQLYDAIQNSFKALNKEELLEVSTIVSITATSLDKSHFDLEELRNDVAHKFTSNYSQMSPETKKSLLKIVPGSAIIDVEKRIVIENGRDLVRGKNIQDFKDHLISNKETLTKNPDSKLKQFFKGLGVFGATLVTAWGLGFGGVLAYKSLFVNTGERLLSDVENIEKRFTKR